MCFINIPVHNKVLCCSQKYLQIYQRNVCDISVDEYNSHYTVTIQQIIVVLASGLSIISRIFMRRV